jgi:hypothetical protein
MLVSIGAFSFKNLLNPLGSNSSASLAIVVYGRSNSVAIKVSIVKSSRDIAA